MTPFYKTLYILLAWLVRIIFNVKVVGRENDPKVEDGPFIVCANHLSATDPIAVASAMRHIQPNFMAKSQLFKNKLVSWFLRSLGAYPVSRDGKDVGALSTSLDMLKEGKTIGMFPQGTRHPGVDPETTKVRNGIGLIAATSGVKVLPMYIETKNNKAKLFKRRTIIIGKPITPEELAFDPSVRGEYNRISNLIFERICQLGREYKQSKTK